MSIEEMLLAMSWLKENPKEAIYKIQMLKDKKQRIAEQQKQLQQEYHSRFMTILPPNKVFSVIKAEERFHRQAYKRMKK